MKSKLAILFCCLATASVYAQSSALSILTQGDGGFCDPQHGEQNGFYSTGCCGAPGRRVCSLVLHFGKGTAGYSAGCTDPDTNLNHSGKCYVQPVLPELGAIFVPKTRPTTGTDVRFVVTSDLHFFRSSYDVADQVEHVKRINGYGAQKQIAGVVLAGDMVTGKGDHKLGAFRMMWENGTTPDSIKFPVYPGMGNHDASAQGTYGMDYDTPAALKMWTYMYQRTALFNVDRNGTGCLVGIDPLCFDQSIAGGSLNYSWDWHGVHFVQLNTWAGDTDRQYSPPLGLNGLKWLQRDLAYRVGNSGRPVVLIQHYRLADMTSTDTKSFADVIAPYNVVGLFSGHTHRLESWRTTLTTSSGATFKVDNFVDGNGGDCTVAGTGSDGTCSDATGNFLGVRVTDKYLEVSANSWQKSKVTYLDKDMGFRDGGTQGTGPKGMGAAAGSSAAVCRKRIAGTPTSLTSSDVSVTVNNTAKQITVQNISGRMIPDVAVKIISSTLRSWDYTDSCSSAATPYLTVADNLQAGASVTIPFSDVSAITVLPSHVVSYAYQLAASPNQVTVPAGTINVNVSAIGGANTAFTITTDQPWIKVSTNSNTTPATLTIFSSSNGPYTPGNVILTPADYRFAPLQIPVSAANQPLNLTSTIPGTSVFVNGTVTALPTTNLVVAPGTSMTLLGTDNAPSPGTQYRFAGWSQTGNPLQFAMPPKPVSLTAKYLPFYSVTLASNPPGGGQVTIVRPSKDGYYQGGMNYTLAVQPAFGFTFAGFSGDLTGTNLTFGLNGPMVITANFNGPPPSTNPGPGNPSPTISFMTNVPVPIPITVGALTAPMPLSQSLQPGTVSLDVPPVYSLSQAPGVQYAFVRWSDGVATPTRTLTVGASSQTLIAEYVQQVLVQVAADPPVGGLVLGEGWYDVGSSVTLTAKANPGAVFVQFFGATKSTTNPVTLQLGTSPITVGAIFRRQ